MAEPLSALRRYAGGDTHLLVVARVAMVSRAPGDGGRLCYDDGVDVEADDDWPP